ncbi:MAG: 50S ribosomal protein L13 [Candidatus Aenigmatarchaeota archaeon]
MATIYDAENQILGRAAAVIAKQLLEGEVVAVVNVEKAVISGSRKYTVSNYDEKTRRGDPHKGPFFPRTPDGIFRRTVRGMLPIKKPKGRAAYKRLRAHIGIPEELNGKASEFRKIAAADASTLKTGGMTLGDLSAALGAAKRW